MPYFPTTEAHYLTSKGDVVDKICWDYYGVTRLTTEEVFKRNRLLADFGAILPAGLLLVLPVVDSADVLPPNQLWNYTDITLPALYATTPEDDRAALLAKQAQDELAALQSYQQQRTYRAQVDSINGAGTPPNGEDPDDGGTGPDPGNPDPTNPTTPVTSGSWELDKEPLSVSDFDYLTVWYRTTEGKWGLGKLPRSAFTASIKPDLATAGVGGIPDGYAAVSVPMIISGSGGAQYKTVEVLGKL